MGLRRESNRSTMDELWPSVASASNYSTNEHGAKSVTKAIKEGGKDTLDRITQRMCEPAKG